VPLKNEQLDGDDDAFFSYTGPDVSEGMVHLLDFDRREDAAINFNGLSAMSGKLNQDLSRYFGWSTSEDDATEAAEPVDASNTLFGSRRLHASAQVIQDAQLAEEHADGETLFGSRRLAALSLILQEGANRTLGAAAGAGEMALGAAGAVTDAVGGAAGAVSGAMEGAAGAVGGAAGAVSDAVGGAAGAVAGAAGAVGGAAGAAVASASGLLSGVAGGSPNPATAAPSSEVRASPPAGVVVAPKTPTPRVSVVESPDGTRKAVRGVTRAQALSRKLAADKAELKPSGQLPPDAKVVTAGMGGTQTIVAAKKQASGNSVSQTTVMDADARVVYAVITDYMHYTVMHHARSRDLCRMCYRLGAWGACVIHLGLVGARLLRGGSSGAGGHGPLLRGIKCGVCRGAPPARTCAPPARTCAPLPGARRWVAGRGSSLCVRCAGKLGGCSTAARGTHDRWMPPHSRTPRSTHDGSTRLVALGARLVALGARMHAPLFTRGGWRAWSRLRVGCPGARGPRRRV